MSPLLLLSPIVLDQSFPRDEEELGRVVDTLGAVQELLAGNKCKLIATEMMELFLEEFNWERTTGHAILYDVHRLLSAIIVREDICVRVGLEGVPLENPHPLPLSASESGVGEIWQIEAGKLLYGHDQRKPVDAPPFVGIPCEIAFSGGAIGTYRNPPDLAHFPLVGPSTVSVLGDAEEWVVDRNDIQSDITFKLAKSNVRVLRGSVKKPKGGSHYNVSFPNGPRPWPLDRNVDPIPDRFVSELPPLCGYPLQVVRYALLHGQLPSRRSRLHDLVV